MKPARLIVLAIALGAGVLALMLTKRPKPLPAPAQQVAVQPSMETVDVLVASGDISVGKALTSGDMAWQTWPKAAATGQVITKDSNPQALENVVGSVARHSFVAGEPLRQGKLIKSDGKGFMAAILTPGMRAIATEVAPETGAGGFILPNDRVDVILTRRVNSQQSEALTHMTTTVLTNVRVLAIDQNVEDKARDRSVIGRTATLELSPQQTEVLALARQLGTLSLALRSLSDNGTERRDAEGEGAESIFTGSGGSRMTIIKHGVATPVTGGR